MGRLSCLLFSCVLLGSSLLAGCAASNTPDEPEGTRVEVNFGDRHRCSRISPEITVYNPPRGTSYYEVRVSLVGSSPERYIGGGRWVFGGLNSDGADIIPEGGLLNMYRSPCPSNLSEKTYRYTVYCMSKDSSQPLAISDYLITLE